MNGSGARDALGQARLMLLFTPSLCGARDPVEVLDAVVDAVDVVQVRLKNAEHPDGASPARELFDWTERVLALVDGRALVLVNDRVDVCAALLARGVAGVHLGDRDTLPRDARGLLGAEALIGLSTHSAADVARACHGDGEADEPVDYLGFGPVFPTATKGYARGRGPEAAWVAAQASPLPRFPIGGITPENAGEHEHVGRACVGAAILGARDPRGAALAIRAALARG
jgi:thiamine-phosphate pyrophosphorylase